MDPPTVRRDPACWDQRVKLGMGMVQQVLAEGMEYREETDLGALRGPVDRYVAIYRPISHWRRLVRRVTRDSMDTAQFFFSFESGLPEMASPHLSEGLQKESGQVSQKPLAMPVFIGQNESCPLLQVPPCHHTKSRTNWPVKWASRKVALGAPQYSRCVRGSGTRPMPVRYRCAARGFRVTTNLALSGRT